MIVFSTPLLFAELMGAKNAFANPISILRSNSGSTAIVKKTYDPEEKNVNGLIQAGFPKEKAEQALKAVGAP